MEKPCFLCDVLAGDVDVDIILENEVAFVCYSEFASCDHHLLVVSKQHVASLIDLSLDTYVLFQKLARDAVLFARDKHGFVDYNFGLNDGLLAGQSVMHVHQHIFPRFAGDVANPAGGVRNMFSGGNYIEEARKGKRKKYV